jgi:N-carbamoyl-L-amino-acid hydrolase
MPTASNVRINGARLWDSLMTMAEIGATAKGGVNRPSLSDLDGAARALLIRWCEAAGCSIRVDRMGSIFARQGPTTARLPS